jgi:hypothetical protein
MKHLSTLLLAVLFLAPGCISFRLSAESDPSIRASGLGNAYAGYSGVDEWDGDIIKLGLLGGHGRDGEIFSLDIWPLGGVGIGLAGARVRILPIEFGAGALFYKPTLPRREEDLEDLPAPEKPAETKTKAEAGNEAADKK